MRPSRTGKRGMREGGAGCGEEPAADVFADDGYVAGAVGVGMEIEER